MDWPGTEPPNPTGLWSVNTLCGVTRLIAVGCEVMVALWRFLGPLRAMPWTCIGRVCRRLPALAMAGRQSRPFAFRPFAFAIASTLACTFSPAGQTASGSLSIRYQNDVMDFWIDDRPLKQVIEAHERASGVQVVLIDPAITAWPVSGAARGVSLEEGLKTILHGFSYAFHRGNPRLTLVVLATPPGPRPTSDPGVELKPGSGVASPVANDGVNALDVDATPAALKAPQTLDEFRPVVQAADDPEAPDLDANASFQEAEYREALLQRALDALKSEHQQLRPEALDQLASFLDLRATEALIAAANGGGELRALAVEALTRHAANHEYADATSVAALQQIAQDSDPAVKQLAQQALEAMDQYQLATAGQ